MDINAPKRTTLELGLVKNTKDTYEIKGLVWKPFESTASFNEIFEEGKNTRDQYRYDEVRRQPV